MSARIDTAKNEAYKYASVALHHGHTAEKYLQSKDYHKAS